MYARMAMGHTSDIVRRKAGLKTRLYNVHRMCDRIEAVLSDQYRYKPEILEELAHHGLAPRPETPPQMLRDAINDLYRYEIRRLRDRCRAGEFSTQELPTRVVELRKRYILLSIPLAHWAEP